MKKDKKKDKPANKTPELSKAKKALDAYLKENNLDPTKDWSKDKKHGKKVTELLNKLNKERDKVAAQYPEKDLKNEAKLVKMKKAKEDEKALKKKEKKESTSRVTKYDYPLIDGREMTSDEKKKYRMEQRKLAAGKAPKEEKPKKEKKEKAEAAEKVVPAKKDKKAKDKKKKKAKKEED
jgi:hypothetical protein|nr:MAG: hypothetical protein [Bacteriophage sp.]